MLKMTDCGLKPTQRYSEIYLEGFSDMFLTRQTLMWFWFFVCSVGKVVLGKRRIWKTAKDSEAASPVMSGD